MKIFFRYRSSVLQTPSIMGQEDVGQSVQSPLNPPLYQPYYKDYEQSRKFLENEKLINRVFFDNIITQQYKNTQSDEIEPDTIITEALLLDDYDKLRQENAFKLGKIMVIQKVKFGIIKYLSGNQRINDIRKSLTLFG